MLQLGEKLGDWIIDGTLGSGATGSVFRCHHVVTGRLRAAVKVIRLAEMEEGGRWFLREVEALARLTHPGIVAIRSPGMDVHRGLLYIAMELVEGESLLSVLRRGPLPVPAFRQLLGRVAEALAFAHSHNIYHRDIKPSNIMIRADGSPVLVDFGVSVDLESDGEGPESRIGTPSYMPPEAFLSGAVDPARADVYAFGVLMCESLTGRRAFERTVGGDETQYKNVKRQKLAATELDPGPAIPDDLRALVRAATAPWPDQRTIRMDVLAQALLRGGPEAGSSATLVPQDATLISQLPASGPQLTPPAARPAGFGAAPTPSIQPSAPDRSNPARALLDATGTMAGPPEAQKEVTRWLVGGAVAAVILSLVAGGFTWWWMRSLP